MEGLALVTGPTSGIGYEIADILADRGYDLFLVSRNTKKLRSISKSFEKTYKIKTHLLSIDLSKPGAAQEVYSFAKKKKLQVDVLINNAGIGVDGLFTQGDLGKVHTMNELNINAVTELATLFGKDMQKRRHGYILNVSSIVGHYPTPYMAVYAATKAFVLNFSMAIAKELEDYDVQVTCLSPGVTKTGFFKAMGERDAWEADKRMSARRVAEVGVNALFAKKLSVVVGFKNKLGVIVAKLIPKTLMIKIAKSLMKD